MDSHINNFDLSLGPQFPVLLNGPNLMFPVIHKWIPPLSQQFKQYKNVYYHYIIAFTEYVEDIFQTYLTSSQAELSDAASKLRNMTPAPMNTMLEKQSREEAIAKRAKRAKIVVEDVPPTSAPGEYICSLDRHCC